MLGKYGETLLIDWGLAKATGKRDPDRSGASEITFIPPSASRHAPTVAGQRLGSPPYMSPEQAAGKIDELNARTDVYGLGAILYALLTGQPPVPGGEDKSVDTICARVQRGEIAPPRSLNPHIPRALEAVCRKALALNPTDRYPSARALADDIEHWLADEPVAAYPEGAREHLARWSRRYRAWVRAGVAALMVVTVVFGISMMAIEGARRSERIQKERAIDLERQTKLALQEVERRNDQIARQSAQFALDEGLSLCEKGELAQGVLWMARGANLAPRSAGDLQRIIRTNLASWSREIHARRMVIGERGRILDAAFSPDGSMIVSGGSDGSAQFWDATTGRPVGPPMKHDGPVSGVAFSPDGETVLTGYHIGDNLKSGRAQLWDAKTSQPRGQPLFHGRDVRSVAFSPDGKVAITAGGGPSHHGGLTRLWDAKTGQRRAELWGHGEVVTAAVFSSDGASIATTCLASSIMSVDNLDSIRLWDSDTLRPRGDLIKHKGSVLSLAFSPDGKRFLTCGYGAGSESRGEAQIWDTQTARSHGAPVAKGESIDCAAFSRNGRMFLTGGQELRGGGIAQLWDAESGRSLGPAMRFDEKVQGVAFSPVEDCFLIVAGRAIVMELAPGQPRLSAVSIGDPAPLYLRRGLVRTLALSAPTGGLCSWAAPTSIQPREAGLGCWTR